MATFQVFSLSKKQINLGVLFELVRYFSDLQLREGCNFYIVKQNLSCMHQFKIFQ